MEQMLDQADTPVDSGAPIEFNCYLLDETGDRQFVPLRGDEEEWVKTEYCRLFDTLAVLSCFSVDVVGYIVAMNAYVNEQRTACVYEIVLQCNDLTRVERAFLMETVSRALQVEPRRILITFASGGDDEEDIHRYLDSDRILSPQEMIEAFRRAGRLPQSLVGLDKSHDEEV